MEANKITVKPLTLSFLAVFAIELATTPLTSQNLHHPLLVLGAARLLEIVLIIIIVFIWGEGPKSIGLTQSKIIPGLKRGLIWSAGFGTITGLTFATLFLAGINPLKLLQVRLPAKPDGLVLYFVVGGIVGPVAEEVFFRGVLYGFLRRWGVAVAIVLSTLLFLLGHGIVHRVPITQAVGGILFAVAYEVENILIVPITIHCLGNLAIFSLSLTY
jgi:membrane protease YdiL (CAAX protease family)